MSYNLFGWQSLSGVEVVQPEAECGLASCHTHGTLAAEECRHNCPADEPQKWGLLPQQAQDRELLRFVVKRRVAQLQQQGK